MKALSRRAVLRGAGVALSLPWLEALAPRRAEAAGASTPRRFLLCVFPNGAPHDWWEGAPAFGQTSTGAAFRLPNVLTPFAPLKSKLLMVSRLGNYTWAKGGTRPEPTVEPSHARCMAALTTCVDTDDIVRRAGLQVDSGVRNAVSVDQLFAAQQSTAVSSLQTGLGVKPGMFDGRSYAYNQVLSWKSPTEALKRQVNPRAVFDALVGATAPGSSQAREALAAKEQSVLDAVRSETLRLQQRVSARDRVILEQYLDSVRTLEQRTASLAAVMCQPPARPAAVPEPPGPAQGLTHGQDGYDHEAHADVMNELITLAFQCDRTRVVTHLLDDARSEFEYRHIPRADRERVGLTYRAGDSLHYHGEQHGSGALGDRVVDGRYQVVTPSNRGYAAINGWMSRKVAELALRLDAIREGDGSVLDHTVLVFCSEMRTHDHDGFDLPMLLVGGQGVLRHDAHVALQPVGQDRQVRDLWFTLLRRWGSMPVTSFGEDVRGVANAELSDVLA